MTNIVQELEKKWPSFDEMWKESLSFFPQVPVNWEEREKLKEFAREIYNHIVDLKSIEEIVEEAYNDGYNDGLKDGYEDGVMSS